jgi:hypothetical protein
MPAIAAAMIGTSPHLIFTYSELDVRNGSWLCENSKIEFSDRKLVSILSIRKITALANTIGKRQ